MFNALRIAREIIIGPRGIVKANEALLPLAAALLFAPAGRASATAAVALPAAVACWCQACILANDWVDRAADAAAGKARWIASWPPVGAAVLISGLLTLGAFLSGWHGGRKATAIFLAASAFGLAYSFPPLILKRRGAGGHFGYAAAGALAFAVLPAAAFDSPPLLAAALSLAVFLDKWVNLDFHQIVDFEADAAAGTPTLAIRTGLARSRARLRIEAAAAAAALIAAAVAVLRRAGPLAAAATGAAFLLAALYAARTRRRHRDRRLTAELPPIYLGASFAVLRVAPLATFLTLARIEPRTLPLAALVAALIGLETAHAARYRYR